MKEITQRSPPKYCPESTEAQELHMYKGHRTHPWLRHRSIARQHVERQDTPAPDTGLRHPILSGIMVAAVATIFSIGVTYYFYARQLESTYAFTTIQTRISTCLAISEHYRSYGSDDASPVIGVLENGENVRISSNFERYQKSINMARALDLCLIEGGSLDGLNDCIILRTTDGKGNYDPYVSVIDTRSSSPPDQGNIWPAKRNPIC
jgi:hypothetical protein